MTWQLVAHRSELAKPQDYVILSAGAEQLLTAIQLMTKLSIHPLPLVDQVIERHF